MRILLVADIHGNWPALQALNEPHDLCICLGDLVDYGLEPGPCIEWARQNVRYLVRGNHDHHAAQDVTITGNSGFRYLTAVTGPITRSRLRPDDVRFLADMPVSQMLTIDDLRILLVHGSPRDPLDEYGRPTVEFWEDRLRGIDVDLVCVGHTHQPYALEVGATVVVNPGSVGLPRDGDPRAAYALIEDGQVELKRVPYDIEATVRTLHECSLPERAKAMLSKVFRTGGTKVYMKGVIAPAAMNHEPVP
jgi:putative phosphoesterase